jgi:DNA repair exonuclease SbcCD nuclease subunit
MTRRPLRVLHTAHLDSDGYGADGHRERERLAFRRIVDRVLADRVDLLLIAGDLFDHNRASG